MEKNLTPAKAAIGYGVAFGIVMILEFVIAYALDLDYQKDAWVGIMNSVLNYLVLPVLFITLACNRYKRSTGGYISFGQCIKAGVSVTVIAAALFALFNVIFNMIFPEFQAEMMQKTAEIMAQQNPNMTSEQMKQALKMTEMFMKPYIALPFTILMYAFLGLILSLIVGAAVKKDNPGAFN